MPAYESTQPTSPALLLLVVGIPSAFVVAVALLLNWGR